MQGFFDCEIRGSGGRVRKEGRRETWVRHGWMDEDDKRKEKKKTARVWSAIIWMPKAWWRRRNVRGSGVLGQPGEGS